MSWLVGCRLILAASRDIARFPCRANNAEAQIELANFGKGDTDQVWDLGRIQHTTLKLEATYGHGAFICSECLLMNKPRALVTQNESGNRLGSSVFLLAIVEKQSLRGSCS